jgi:hypothetical protein
MGGLRRILPSCIVLCAACGGVVAATHEDPARANDAGAASAGDSGTESDARGDRSPLVEAGAVGDGRDPDCPTSLASADFGSCRVLGQSCRYAEGACTCQPLCIDCVPRSCREMKGTCGVMGDGCGDILTLTCPPSQTCVGGTCVVLADAGPTPACTPKTCTTLGAVCGWHDDGCGGCLDCGDCIAWRCIDTTLGCPVTEPIVGSGCSSVSGLCTYSRWPSPSCCEMSYACTSGHWERGEQASSNCPQ